MVRVWHGKVWHARGRAWYGMVGVWHGIGMVWLGMVGVWHGKEEVWHGKCMAWAGWRQGRSMAWQSRAWEGRGNRAWLGKVGKG